MFTLVRFLWTRCNQSILILGSITGCGSVARTYLLSVLEQGIKVGEICIHEGDKTTTLGTPSKTKDPVNIYVRDERFWTHVFLCVWLFLLLLLESFAHSDGMELGQKAFRRRCVLFIPCFSRSPS
jgi:hypothetical protein